MTTKPITEWVHNHRTTTFGGCLEDRRIKEIRDSLLCHVLFNAVNYMLGGVILSAPYVLAELSVRISHLLVLAFERGPQLARWSYLQGEPLHTSEISQESVRSDCGENLSVTQFLELFDTVLLVSSRQHCYWKTTFLQYNQNPDMAKVSSSCSNHVVQDLTSLGSSFECWYLCVLRFGVFSIKGADALVFRSEVFLLACCTYWHKKDWRDVMSSVGFLAVFSTCGDSRAAYLDDTKINSAQSCRNVHHLYVCVFLTAIVGYFFMSVLRRHRFSSLSWGTWCSSATSNLTKTPHQRSNTGLRVPSQESSYIAYMINLTQFPLCLVPVSKITCIWLTAQYLSCDSRTNGMEHSCSSRLDLDSWLCHDYLIDRYFILHITLRCLSFSLCVTSLEQSLQIWALLLHFIHYYFYCSRHSEFVVYVLGGYVVNTSLVCLYHHIY